MMLLGTMTLLSVLSAAAIGWASGAYGSWQWLWVLPVSFVGTWLGLFLLAFLFLWLMCAVVRLDKPQEADSPFYRKLADVYIQAVLKILRMRVHTRGLEQTPTEGRFLLVCNHLNDMDPLTLLACFRHSQLAFISKRENQKLFLVGKIMHKLLCQPINRENDREALKTILRCVQILREDQASVAVFPEGYTSRDGLFHGFRNGVFKIAQKAQVPIVVCTLQNTQYVFRNALRLKPTDVHLHLLAVIPPEELKGLTAVAIGDRVHKLLADDLGPENVAES